MEMKIIFSSKWLANGLGLALKQGCFQAAIIEDGFLFNDGNGEDVVCDSGSQWIDKTTLELFYVDAIQLKQMYDFLKFIEEQPITLILKQDLQRDSITFSIKHVVVDFHPFIKTN